MKYFMPGYAYWYTCMLKYPQRYRYGLTCIVLLSILSIWYFVLYTYVNSTICYYTKTNGTMRTQIIEQKKKEQHCTEIVQATKMFRQELQSYKTAQLEPNILIMHILKQLPLSNMLLINSLIESPINHEWYTVYPFVLDGQSSLDNMSKFLRQISLKTKLILLSAISITQISSDIFRFSLRLNCLHIHNF
jgi:hypothetical protein